MFRPPGPMGPRGVQGPHLRPDMPMHFQGPGGPRQGPPIGPLFPGPEGPMMGPRMRGHMPLRMQGGPGVGRGMPTGPRPLLPEMVSFVCIQFLHRFIFCKRFFPLFTLLCHPIGFKTNTFSCAFRQFLVFLLSFDWLRGFSTLFMIGQSEYFGFSFTILN